MTPMPAAAAAWVCPCGCTPIGAALPPAGPTPPIQLDLFAFATA